MIIRRLTLLLTFLLYVICLKAQHTEYKLKRKNHSTSAGYVKASRQARYLSVGLGLSAQSYFGDLTPKEKYIKNGLKVIRPGISTFAMYNFNPIVFFTGDLSFNRITGDDSNSDPYRSAISNRKYVRNLSFRNDLVGLTLRANANVFRDPFEYFKRRDYNIYFFSGISIFYSNPKTKVPETGINGEAFENAGEWVALRPLGTGGQNSSNYGEKYRVLQVGIPFGGGLRYRIGHKLDLMVEGSLHYLLSDYIDDVGGKYVDLGIFEDELAKALSDRSKEEVAALKGEIRDAAIISESTTSYTYESQFDGKMYTVFEGFGHDGNNRGGNRNDIIATFTIKISYIFTN